MNQLKKQLLCFAILASASHLFGANTVTNIVPRSQSFNAARQIVGWDNSEWGINRKALDDRYYLSFNLAFEYSRTFRNKAITECLFGDDLVCGECDDLAINVSGSLVENRGANDWLGDYFGLPFNYKSTVTFKPVISNFILDFSFYAGLDAWIEGMYFKAYSPFVHTKWNLNATECGSLEVNPTSTILAYSDLAYPAGYFSSVGVPAENTVSSFLEWSNGAVPIIPNGYQDDVIWQPLCCGRIADSCACDCTSTSRNGFGEIRFVLGRNFFPEDTDKDCHIGGGIYAAAPTGTRVGSSRYLFQPIVGNGKHWELGGQITAHSICWTSEDENKSFGVYLEANITHLFGAHQTRCLDLCSAGSNSRYMLAEKLESFPNPLNGAVTLNTSVDSVRLQYANEVAPVANITRRDITSTIGAQGDLAISFAYRYGNFQWDLGYNFWGRSCEKLRMDSDCCPVIVEPWALKGTLLIYGFSDDGVFTPVPLAATNSLATIHNGANNTETLSFSSAIVGQGAINKFIDNNVLAIDNSSNEVLNQPLPGAAQTYTSNRPILIDEADFNFTGTRGISNKIFTHFNWASPYCNESKWTPYLGVGAEAEFGTKVEDRDCCNNGCYTACEPAPTCSTLTQCCSNCAISQWGVWFKVGASYN